MTEQNELEELALLSAALERLRETTQSPGVAMALGHAISQCHLATIMLGSDGLAFDVDEPTVELR